MGTNQQMSDGDEIIDALWKIIHPKTWMKICHLHGWSYRYCTNKRSTQRQIPHNHIHMCV